LLDLSIANVRQYKFDKAKQAERLNPEQRTTNLLKELQQKLKLPKLPMHIECFDNSNIQGADAVAACVVFKQAKPSKKDYRKYNIKTVEGPDDYASMAEVVFRRYSPLLPPEKQAELGISHDTTDHSEHITPNLIIADGGKGQMEIIRKIVHEKLNLDIPIAGLAKDGKHKTSELLAYNNGQIVTIGIESNSPLFLFLTRIQDEVHRFAIQFHREKRSKRQISSELDNIKGIGETTKNTLLKHFKSVNRIKQASVEELSDVIGQTKAKLIKENLK
jgi:excinuclease ABC subunit C